MRDNMSISDSLQSRRYYLLAMLIGACQGTSASRTPENSSKTCLREGDGDSSLSRREVSRPCCPGLLRIRGYETTSMASGQCLASKGGYEICTLCGNGQCGTGEDICNCPQDCGH